MEAMSRAREGHSEFANVIGNPFWIALASALCHSLAIDIASMPAFKKPFDNPVSTVELAEGSAAGVLVAPGSVSVIWPFVWTTATCPGWPFTMRVRDACPA